MDIYDLFSLLGGLALFLYGMTIMGDALEKRAGKRLKPILEQLTSRPLRAVLLGAGVTAVIQSSSATTVMVVGFVNSGIMQLRQAIGVVMGANIGTTVTAWILSLAGIRSDTFWLTLLKPSTFSPLLAFLGIILLLGFKRHRDTAGILLGFAVLMYGMQAMSDAVQGLSGEPAFIHLLVLFQNPLFGVMVGTLVTAIIQSSSASVGILQAIAITGTLSFGSAIPIIMGQNIGTCITAILSSIGANRNAKRVAAAHLLFNLIGTLVFLTLFYLLNALIGFSFTDLPINALYIAIIHTLFNVMTTALLFPFTGFLERLARLAIPDGRKGEQLVLLDERLLNTPAIALEQSRKLTLQMAQQTREAFFLADSLQDQFDPKVVERVNDLEEAVDRCEDAIGSYLIKVSAKNLSTGESREAAKLLHIIGDLERISDHAVNLCESAQEVFDKKLAFSGEARKETIVLRRAVRDVVGLAVDALAGKDLDLALRVEPLEEVVDGLRDSIKAGHVGRLQTGACTLELGFVLSDLLNNLERVSDHCSNIAANLIQIERSGTIDYHEYKKTLQSGEAGERFRALYEAYAKEYRLD
ncbi:MAG: Na/Pi cotransporter family protein [Christensenellales bacterium]